MGGLFTTTQNERVRHLPRKSHASKKWFFDEIKKARLFLIRAQGGSSLGQLRSGEIRSG